HDALHEKFTEKQTYGDVLKQVKKDHITYLSGKKLTRIRATNNFFLLHKTDSVLRELDTSLTETEKTFKTAKK
ncbi:hypothetical protein, partial [uncultured Flavobacterium sp.]|uniref:hypothetical protein n=1 Tax=uncultured Flavobacterium sp. TaxID=165435 RepID=UPI0025CB9907